MSVEPGPGPCLEGLVAERLGPRHPRWLAVRVTAEGVERVHHGIPPGSDVEIGSVSKAVTGMVFADSVERGEVSADTRLGDLLPLAASPAAAVTLGVLATHTSGLPRLAADPGALAAAWRLWWHGTNPYGASLETLLARTRKTKVGPPRAAYSNLGFMLLGHAVAAAAGRSYADLLAERFAAPLGLAGTYAPATPEELSDRSVVGTDRRGRGAQAWTGVDVAPAGGIRMTADDLATLLRATLDGSAPGMRALDPMRAFGREGGSIGFGWLTLKTRAGERTWHNGGTGGFRSIVVLDRGARRGIAIVTATARLVDGAGFALLENPSPR